MIKTLTNSRPGPRVNRTLFTFYRFHLSVFARACEGGDEEEVEEDEEGGVNRARKKNNSEREGVIRDESKKDLNLFRRSLHRQNKLQK